MPADIRDTGTTLAQSARTRNRQRTARRNRRDEEIVLNEERRRAILELVNQDGRVLVKELATRFGTSEITIRKDLEELHAQGRIHRTHGGAAQSRR